MNEAQIVVTGNVANRPSLGSTPAGVSVANMRLGYTPRYRDRESGQWVDGNTSWITVKCWRKLADHVAMCLNKGDPVVVKGALQVRPFTDKEGNQRLGVEVLASAVGHDLNRGVTHFLRTGRKSGPVTAAGPGETAGGASAQPRGEVAGGDVNGHAGDARAVPGFGLEPGQDPGADDADADMFDEGAVVAAALHAVPDLEEGMGEDSGGPGGPGAVNGAEAAAVDEAGGDRGGSGAHEGDGPSAAEAPAGRVPGDGDPADATPARPAAEPKPGRKRRPGRDRDAAPGPAGAPALN